MDKLSKSIPVWCRARSAGSFTVVSDVVGVVSKISVKEGDGVRKGDTLMYVYRGPAYGYAPILSMASGKVELITVSVGDPVDVGTVLAFLSAGGGEVVEMVLPSTYASKVRVGMPVKYDGKMGRITMLSRVPVREVGGYLAKAKFSAYVRGMGICRIVYDEKDSLKVIPKSSIYKGKVFIVKSGRAKAVPVDVIFDDGKGNVGVEGKLKVGDTVVVLGMESLKDGDVVVF